jgi:hypothetical protein
MKYVASTVKDRVELIVREEINSAEDSLAYEAFIEQFIYHVSDRITELIQNELKYNSEKFK